MAGAFEDEVAVTVLPVEHCATVTHLPNPHLRKNSLGWGILQADVEMLHGDFRGPGI
jgi:hypothetical protein